MLKQQFEIENIPAVLWSTKSDKLFIAIHGNMSNKEDDVIAAFAEEAAAAKYQVISFDLPEHGDRKDEGIPCKVQNCIQDLETVMRYAKTLSNDISIFACGMGAYFSLLSYWNDTLRQSLFLSPVVDMERIIGNMMDCFNISEDRLKAEQEIITPVGQILYWNYYCFVKSHPITTWNTPTAILYGSDDNLCGFDTASAFAERFNCSLRIMEHGEHYFHTEEQLDFFKKWIKEILN